MNHIYSLATIKPTVLPYAHLFDIDACAQFVSDYIFYTPSKPIAVPTLASPTYTLATQVQHIRI